MASYIVCALGSSSISTACDRLNRLCPCMQMAMLFQPFSRPCHRIFTYMQHAVLFSNKFRPPGSSLLLSPPRQRVSKSEPAWGWALLLQVQPCLQWRCLWCCVRLLCHQHPVEGM